MKRLPLCIALLLVLLAPAAAAATTAKGPGLLSQGVEAYEYKDYQKAWDLLSRSLSAGGLGPGQMAWAHCYLGATAYAQGRLQEAEHQFGLAKAFSPGFKAPAWALGPEVVAAFERAPALGQGLRPKPRAQAPPAPKARPRPAPAAKPAAKTTGPKPTPPQSRAGAEPELDIPQAAALAAAGQRRKAELAKVEGVSQYNAQHYTQAVRSFDQYLKVFPDDVAVQNWRREALRLAGEVKVGTVTVLCEPRAQVLLDGKPVGLSPITLSSVPAGERLVAVRALGASQEKRVRVRGRTAYELSFTLTGGELEVRSEPWAVIELDGKEVGQTPMLLDNLVLGPHRLRLWRDGYIPQEHQVELRAGHRVKLEAVLQPR